MVYHQTNQHHGWYDYNYVICGDDPASDGIENSTRYFFYRTAWTGSSSHSKHQSHYSNLYPYLHTNKYTAALSNSYINVNSYSDPHTNSNIISP